MTHETPPLLDENTLLHRFEELVRDDRCITAMLLRYIAEIDQRRLWAKHAYPSMFAFCVQRFHMSEAIVAKRIRAGRTASRFPRVLVMVERGELHLTAVHQLASHLTEENHRWVLARAKHRTMREIEHLIAEIAPKPDVPSRVVTLPIRNQTKMTEREQEHDTPASVQRRRSVQIIPLSPRRYKMQVTLSQETRDKLTELQELLSHQIPDGDPAKIVDKALDALLENARKQKAAVTNQPRKRPKRSEGKTRTIAAAVKREVFKRDEGQCKYVDSGGNRCAARRFIEFHHKDPYGRGGGPHADNIELRCQAHNQYEADLDYGKLFMNAMRYQGRRPDP